MNKKYKIKKKLKTFFFNEITFFFPFTEKIIKRFKSKKNIFYRIFLISFSIIGALIFIIGIRQTLAYFNDKNSDDYFKSKFIANQKAGIIESRSAKKSVEDFHKEYNLDKNIDCTTLSEQNHINLVEDDIILNTVTVKNNKIHGGFGIKKKININKARELNVSLDPFIPKKSSYYVLVRNKKGQEIFKFEVYDARIDFIDIINNKKRNKNDLMKETLNGVSSDVYMLIYNRENDNSLHVSFDVSNKEKDDDLPTLLNPIKKAIKLNNYTETLFEFLSVEIGIIKNEEKNMNKKHSMEILSCIVE